MDIFVCRLVLSDKRAYLTGVVMQQTKRHLVLRLTATSEQQNAPTITMREVPNSNPKSFVGDVGYTNLPEYGVAYTYQFKARVTDTQGNITQQTKNVTFRKLDDVKPIAVLGSVEGLVGNNPRIKSMSTALNNDNKVDVEVEVNENTSVALESQPKLTLLGPNGTATLVEVRPSGTGPSGTYRFEIALSKDDYQFHNLEAAFNQGSRIVTESIKLELEDGSRNEVLENPVELLTFNVQLIDAGLPYLESQTIVRQIIFRLV